MKSPDRYALTVCATGLILTGVSWVQMDWSPSLLVLYASLLVLATSYRLVRVRLPHRVYASFTPLYAFVGLYLVGPAPTGALLAVGILLTVGLGKSLRSALFNIGQFLLAIYVAAGAYQLLGGRIPPPRLDRITLLQLFAGCLVFLVSNLLVVYACEVLQSRAGIRRLARNLRWEGIIWALSYGLCVLTLALKQTYSLSVLEASLVLYPLLALCYVFSRIIDNHIVSRQMSRLTDFMTHLSAPRREEEILDYLFSRLWSIIDYECCAVWTREPGGQIVLRQCQPLSPQVTPVRAPEVFRRAASGAALQGRWVPEESRRWWRCLQKVPAGYLIVPMIYDGQVQGLLQLEQRGTHEFTRMDLKLLSWVSENLALALEQSRLVQELRSTQADLLNILTSSHIAIVVTDRHHRVRIFNSGAEELSGFSEEQIQGRPAAQCLPPQDYRRVRRLLLRNGKVEDLEVSILTAKGDPVPVSLSASILRDPMGQFTGTLAVGYDIARRKLLQARMVQNEKLAALGRLVTGITHEINNRLQPILGYTQLLRRSPFWEEYQVPVVEIEKSAVEARSILQSLLSFWQPSEPQRELCNLNESIQNVLRILRIDGERIRVDLQLDPELPATLCDKYQIETVIFHLLKNALQALQSKGGRLEIRTETEPDHVRLVVRDDGPGMSERMSARVFDPFFTTKAVGQGVGLGLSLCYGILQAHAGTIRLRSGLGRGTEVSFRLPRKSVPSRAEQAAEAAEEKEAGGGGRIFIIDDESSIRNLLEDIFCEEYEVSSFCSGKEAIEAMQQQDFDLCICDLRMPEMDGIEIYHWVCENLSKHQKDFIFITGDTFGPTAQSFLDRVGSKYLCKPFSVVQIEQVVREHFQNRLAKDASVN